MQISDINANLMLTVEKVRGSTSGSLRVGETVQAAVVSPTRQNRALLSIKGSELLVKTGLELSRGEQLQLRVTRAANPVELLLLRESTGDKAQSTALRQALPRQIPLGRLVGELSRLSQATPNLSRLAVPGASPPPGKPAVKPLPPQQAAQQPVSRPPSQPALSAIENGLLELLPKSKAAELQQAVQRILDHVLSGQERLQPARLQQLFAQSGLFMEAHLAKSQIPVLDLKASLLRLIFQLRPYLETGRRVPGQPSSTQPQESQTAATNPSPVLRLLQGLSSLTEGSLARVLVNQLASLPSNEGPQQVWHFELPIRHPDGTDSFRVRFARQRKSIDGKEEDIWSVNLAFDLEPLGPVTSRLVLQGNEITSHFIAEREQSAQRLEQAMPILGEALVRAGLRIGSMTTGHGPASSQEDAPPRTPYPLLDEKA